MRRVPFWFWRDKVCGTGYLASRVFADGEFLMAIIYLDGRYLPQERAKIPATDPALAWGVGLFEVIRGYHGRGFQLGSHLRRLEGSARYFGIEARLPDLGSVVTRLFEKNALDGGYVRVTLTGGGHLIVSVNHWSPLPKSWYTCGGRLAIAPFRKDPRAPLSGHKTLNYLENMRVRWEAERHGVIDALVLGFRGEVLEGTRCNIFVARRGRLVTPSLKQGILPGVTRQLVIELAREASIPLRERSMRFTWLRGAEEVFITSTMMEIVPIVRVGDTVFPGPGPLTRILMRAYRERVARECFPHLP